MKNTNMLRALAQFLALICIMYALMEAFMAAGVR